MELQSAASALTTAMDQQMLGASVVTKTLDRMNGVGVSGATPNADFQFQKDLLSAAYAEKGVGTKLDITA